MITSLEDVLDLSIFAFAALAPSLYIYNSLLLIDIKCLSNSKTIGLDNLSISPSAGVTVV